MPSPLTRLDRGTLTPELTPIRGIGPTNAFIKTAFLELNNQTSPMTTSLPRRRTIPHPMTVP